MTTEVSASYLRGPDGKRCTFSLKQVDSALEGVAAASGMSALRSYQQAVAKASLVRCDTLALLPTGSGKTLAFWSNVVLYDLLFNGAFCQTDMITRPRVFRPFQVVVCPLRGLMEEQVPLFNKLFPWLKAV